MAWKPLFIVTRIPHMHVCANYRLRVAIWLNLLNSKLNLLVPNNRMMCTHVHNFICKLSMIDPSL